MGKAFSTYRMESCRILDGKREEKKLTENLNVSGRVLLKWILYKMGLLDSIDLPQKMSCAVFLRTRTKHEIHKVI
jgi:hypothetical protein